MANHNKRNNVTNQSNSKQIQVWENVSDQVAIGFGVAYLVELVE